jgi:hypothetical protein
MIKGVLLVLLLSVSVLASGPLDDDREFLEKY